MYVGIRLQNLQFSSAVSIRSTFKSIDRELLFDVRGYRIPIFNCTTKKKVVATTPLIAQGLEAMIFELF